MQKEQIRKIMLRTELKRKKMVRPKLLELGLTVGQGQPRILECLQKKEAMTQKQLSDCCVMDTTTMSRTLDRMQETGLLERKANPSCRRSFLITLTEEGMEKAQTVSKIFAEADEAMFSGISQEERMQFYHILQKIESNLDKIAEGAETGRTENEHNVKSM